MCPQMAVHWSAIGTTAMLLHHLIFPLSYGNGLYGSNPPFGMFTMLVLQLCEASTPFLHVRWFLSTSGHRLTLMYTVNAATFTVVFLAVRGVLMTYMLYYIFQTVENPFHWPGCTSCTIALNCAWAFQALQYMWCYRVLAGFVAVVFGKGAKDVVEQEGEEIVRSRSGKAKQA